MPPDIILIISDDLNYNILKSCYCPTIRNMQSSGAEFVNTYNYGANTGAVCKSSRLMTLYGKKWDDSTKKDALPTLLRKKNYDTFATGKWHLSQDRFYNNFDSYENIFFGGMMSSKSTITHTDDGTDIKLKKKYPGGIFTDSIVKYIKRKSDSDKPYFAYIAYTEPHDPLKMVDKYKAQNNANLPKNFKFKHPFSFGQEHHRDERLMKRPLNKKKLLSNIKKYMTMVSYLDTQIKRITDVLTRPTMVIFTTDNGICQGNHGLLGKQNLYQESIHLPLFIWGSNLNISGKYSQQIYLHDIYPIINNIISEYKEDTKTPSINKLLDEYTSHDFITFRFKDEIYAVIHNDWKLIYYRTIKKWVLYNIQKDPYELKPCNIKEDKDTYMLLKIYILQLIK